MLRRLRNAVLGTGVVLLLAAFALGAAAARYRAEVPAQYRRHLAQEVAGWKIDVGTPGAKNTLGSIAFRAAIPREVLDQLGGPDEIRAHDLGRVATKAHVSSEVRIYYGLGLILSTQKYEDGSCRVASIKIGNPHAATADDPLVRACPFTLTCGLKLGDSLEECRARIPMISKLRNNLYKEVLQGDGVWYHFARNRLIAVEIYDQPSRATAAGTPPPQGIKQRAAQ